MPVSKRRFETVKSDFEELQARAGSLADAMRSQIDALHTHVEEGLPNTVTDFHRANLRHVVRQLRGVEAQLRSEAEGNVCATAPAGIHYAAAGAAKLLLSGIALVPGVVTVTQPGAIQNSIDEIVSIAVDLSDDSGAMLDWVLLNSDEEEQNNENDEEALGAPSQPNFVNLPDGFGPLLRRWRTENSVGLRALATIVGVSERTLYEWEIGAGGRRRASSIHALRSYLQRSSARRSLPGVESSGSVTTDELLAMLGVISSEASPPS